jgi:NAD(P)-dependent dehydrogenase (short-subunit alcohol dehydrogenase family)
MNARTALLAAAGVAAVGALLGRRRMKLRDRVVVITGGSRGLGFILAREFARHGARLALCARTADDLGRAEKALGGADVWVQRCDVADAQQVKAFVAGVMDRYGRIDVLVNNAGIIEVGPLDAMSEDNFRRALDVMFWGMLRTTLAVLPHMRARRAGSIVDVTSIGGKVSIPHLLPYCCAKFAAPALSEGLRTELRRNGIDVVTIVPGLMRTGSHLNARFVGRQQAEFRWFALGASKPLVSMDAERAARQILGAVRRGQAADPVPAGAARRPGARARARPDDRASGAGGPPPTGRRRNLHACARDDDSGALELARAACAHRPRPGGGAALSTLARGSRSSPSIRYKRGVVSLQIARRVNSTVNP